MKNTQEQMLEIMQKRERRRAAYWRRVAIMFYGTIGVIVVLAVYMGTR